MRDGEWPLDPPVGEKQAIPVKSNISSRSQPSTEGMGNPGDHLPERSRLQNGRQKKGNAKLIFCLIDGRKIEGVRNEDDKVKGTWKEREGGGGDNMHEGHNAKKLSPAEDWRRNIPNIDQQT